MAGITTRITLYVMIACFLLGLINELAILPDVNTMPGWDNNEDSFEAVANPNASEVDWVVGAAAMAFTAITMFIKSLISVVFIIPVLAQYGVDMAYILMIQGLLWGLYGYDAIAIWKGWDPL